MDHPAPEWSLWLSPAPLPPLGAGKQWEAVSLEPLLCLKTLIGKGQQRVSPAGPGRAQGTFAHAPQLARAPGCFEATGAFHLTVRLNLSAL